MDTPVRMPGGLKSMYDRSDDPIKSFSASSYQSVSSSMHGGSVGGLNGDDTRDTTRLSSSSPDRDGSKDGRDSGKDEFFVANEFPLVESGKQAAFTYSDRLVNNQDGGREEEELGEEDEEIVQELVERTSRYGFFGDGGGRIVINGHGGKYRAYVAPSPSTGHSYSTSRDHEQYTGGTSDPLEGEEEYGEGDQEQYGFDEEGDGEQHVAEEEVTSDSFVSTTSSGTSSSVISWITWFCSLPGHEFFLEVPEDFIEDDFNLTGLNTIVHLYNEALDMILDLEPEDPFESSQLAMIEASAELLYGLIHARYIVTKSGLVMMGDKYQAGEFGFCPRTFCGGCATVPMGLSDVPDVERVKMYCPRCGDVYVPREGKHHNIDGAFFGTTFPHMLFMTFPELTPPITTTLHHHPSAAPYPYHRRRSRRRNEDSDTPDTESSSSEDSEDSEDDDDSDDDSDDFDDELEEDEWYGLYQIYTPKIFGFRINERARNGPRMTWLRWKEGMPIPGPPLLQPSLRPPSSSSGPSTSSSSQHHHQHQQQQLQASSHPAPPSLMSSTSSTPIRASTPSSSQHQSSSSATRDGGGGGNGGGRGGGANKHGHHHHHHHHHHHNQRNGRSPSPPVQQQQNVVDKGSGDGGGLGEKAKEKLKEEGSATVVDGTAMGVDRTEGGEGVQRVEESSSQRRNE